MSIFVAIAAYRDPDLPRTLADCVARARFPQDLRFGICRQDADPAPLPDVAPARLRLIDVPWQESGGACWARAQAMSLYDGEDFYFQIDSHHRFVQHWDALLLDQIERAGEARPLLTTYAARFDPDRPLPANDHPTAMTLAGFTAQGIPHYGIQPRPDWAARGDPVRARFLSGHFIFTLGRFVADVPYDPDLYFIGEEISLAIRAFTQGYALLHPGVHVMWHEYSRRQRVMHWDDHQPDRGTVTNAGERDAASLAKVCALLQGEAAGRFGCGAARTLAEYEAYAGVHFRRRQASGAARRGDAPPPPAPPGDDVGPVREWQVRLDLDASQLPPPALDRPAFWYVGFHDAAGVEIARADAERAELAPLLRPGPARIVLDRRFRSARPPARWTVWPVDRHRQWLANLSGPVDPAQAQVRDA